MGWSASLPRIWRIAVLGCAIVIGLAWVAHAAPRQTASAVKLRFGADAAATRVVLELDQAAQARLVADGAAGGRVELDFARLKVGDDGGGAGQGLVRTWRLSQGAGGARLSLTLNGAAHVRRRFLLPPADGVAVYRYVVDLESDQAPRPDPSAPRISRPRIINAAAPAAPAIAAPALPPPAELAATPPMLRLVGFDAGKARRAPKTSPRSARIKVIVIDAGHGGRDPGALGAAVREKDVTLAAAMALRDRLQRTGRFKVVMTRDSDVFVPLDTRVSLTRGAGADLFISLHTDFGADPTLRGATVYTLSDNGMERATRDVFSGGFIDVQLPSHDPSVQQILLDLTQRTTRNRSDAFAETLLEHIGARTELSGRGHRDADYKVLLAPDVPAVLLEMGFLTNPQDQAALTTARGRARLMDSVGDAIEAYFAAAAPGDPLAESVRVAASDQHSRRALFSPGDAR